MTAYCPHCDRVPKAPNLTSFERNIVLSFLQQDRETRKEHLAEARRNRLYSGSLLAVLAYLETA